MKVLVVSPHPDDETLGAGGTLIKLKKNGHNIFWLNVTDMKKEYGWPDEKINHRKKQIKDIISFFHFDGFYNLELPPAKLSSLNEEQIITNIRSVFEEIKPEWLIIPGQYDAHSDHHIVYNCCMACTKAFRAPYIKRISTMEIVSETEFGFQEHKFSPNLFIDISEELEEKLEALKIYDTEIETPPFPRSIENVKALATYRGSCCMCKYAEAFQMIKQIE